VTLTDATLRCPRCYAAYALEAAHKGSRQLEVRNAHAYVAGFLEGALRHIAEGKLSQGVCLAHRLGAP
jgi:hypothetical protein